MLKHLKIKNYALIKELSLDFDDDFTVISGDTGSGKSILLNAIGLLFGKRYDKNIINEKKCVIEAIFIINPSFNFFFTNYNLDFDINTIIRREISIEGKSRVFINDTPVTLNKVKELSSHLIEIHSQNESLLIKNENEQINILDKLASNVLLLEKYQTEFINYRNLINSLAEFKANNQNSEIENDFLKFQFDEINEANLIEDEKEELESRILLLSNIEEISETISISNNLLSSENGIFSSLNTIQKKISKFKIFAGLSDRLNTNLIDLNDILSDILSYENNLDDNPKELLQLLSRLDLLNSLLQKHRVTSLKDLIIIKDKLSEKINSSANYNNHVKELNLNIANKFNLVKSLSHKITLSRQKVKNNFENEIVQSLKLLSIPHAKFVVNITEKDKPSFSGIDNVIFSFSANKGKKVENLSKVASGGEVSRLMLAIKYFMSKHQSPKTLIFDEIDTGVSGEIASYMGDLMKDISGKSQLITITHLPQIASKASSHIKVFKEIINNQSQTKAIYLNDNERVNEIAKLLSGKKISSAAILNAKELLNQ
tara:strand:+ start:4880 stop:6511 length:1632 start_codon:yes stop_codon:yes gene_type:complete